MIDIIVYFILDDIKHSYVSLPFDQTHPIRILYSDIQEKRQQVNYAREVYFIRDSRQACIRSWNQILPVVLIRLSTYSKYSFLFHTEFDKRVSNGRIRF